MMVSPQGRLRLGAGGAPSPTRRPSPVESVLYYDSMVRRFLSRLAGKGVQRLDDLNVRLVRSYRAHLAAQPSQYGRPL